VANDSTPVRLELVAMEFDPFSHESQSAPRQRAGDDLTARDLDLRRVASVASVEVRRWVVTEVRLDDDPVEDTDPRHVGDGGLSRGRLRYEREEKMHADAARATAMTQLKGFEQIEQLLSGVLVDVQSEGARLFVIDLAQGSGRSAVARLFTQYARDNSFAELAHGDFKLLGKMVRNLADPDAPGIDLLQGTGMGGMGEEILEELLSAFRAAASEGFKLPEIATTVDAPALQVVPIGVYV